jgi:hypothetical protein
MPADLPIKLDPAVLADLVVKRGIGGLADSELKRGIDGLAGLPLKLGIDRFAGKSEITEGCSDLREIGDSSDLPGISDVRLSKSYGSDAAGVAKSGTSVWRKAALRCFERRCGGVAKSWCCGKAGIAELRMLLVLLVDRWVWRLAGIRSTSRADSVLAGPTASSCDLRTSKQTVAMAAAISGAKVSEAQCFRGFAAETWRDVAHGEKLCRPFLRAPKLDLGGAAGRRPAAREAAAAARPDVRAPPWGRARSGT